MAARVPTIADVAARSGVAKSTVSKVFSPRTAAGEVGATTAARVRAVARELGFEANLGRRARARRRFGNVALVYADKPVIHGVYERLPSLLAAALLRRGFRLLLLPVGGEEAAWRRSVREHLLDGCLCLGTAPPGFEQFAAATGLPLVLANVFGAGLVPAIDPDDAGGATALAEHLAGFGHRRVLYSVDPSDEEHRSFLLRTRAIAAAGLALEVAIGAVEAVPGLVARTRCTAIIAHSHTRAHPVLASLRGAGIAVPGRVSLAAFNAHPFNALCDPPLTTVAVPFEAMARRAADALLAAIEGRPVCPHEVLGETLVIRASTAAAADG